MGIPTFAGTTTSSAFSETARELVSLSVILDLGAPVTTTAEERETSALWDAYSVCLG